MPIFVVTIVSIFFSLFQVALKRIPIKECPNYDLLADLKSTSKETQKEGKEVPSLVSNTKELHENVCKTKQELKSEEVKERCQPEPSETAVNLPVPSTSVQFLATWKLIHTKPQLCFQFLKVTNRSIFFPWPNDSILTVDQEVVFFFLAENPSSRTP